MSLNKRDAVLRAEAVTQVLKASDLLGRAWNGAFLSSLYNHPRAALLAIKRAEVRLARAKTALRKWAR